METQAQKKALLLSVGYGEGHHAAARAVGEELERRGWLVQQTDICAECHPRFFRLTQRFYHFCVRSAPWLWGITYARADKADWSEAVRRPPLRACVDLLAERLRGDMPDALVCTYPLFAFMVDLLREEGMQLPPCYVVVTDSLEISRPWMVSKATLFCLPDEHSAAQVRQRYGLPEARVRVSSFPVRPVFRRAHPRPVPSAENLRLIYAAYAPERRVVADVRAVLSLFPRAHITMLSGERTDLLRGKLAAEIAAGSLELLPRCENMADLFADSHLYIGKAGAATLYEAYSSELPCIVNYALPGQEQGNLRLLLQDGAGIFVESTLELQRALAALMAHHAAGWSELSAAMRRAGRSHGAERLADIIEQHTEHEGN